jgi:hypothetical protein
MKEYLFILFFVASLGLCVLLFLGNREIASRYERYVAETADDLARLKIDGSYDWWMQSIFSEDIYDIDGQAISLGDAEINTLIVFNEKAGCGSCLQLEATDWQQFLKQDGMAERVSVGLICTVEDVKRYRQEFKSMHLEFPVYFETSGALVREMHIAWTPRIFFIYKGKIIGGYTAEMFNREKSKTMMAKFREFVKLH